MYAFPRIESPKTEKEKHNKMTYVIPNIYRSDKLIIAITTIMHTITSSIYSNLTST